MPKYEVYTWWSSAKEIVVEAECEDEAKEKASNTNSYLGIVGDDYVNDSFEIVSIEEVDDDSAV
ncbi:MAG TPA: hypothetical protein DCW74_02050 [Alteromonas australica]|uniref:Uncharacterized protein n=1 Tax=Alteromonas australica TaxID=589873 RepID=A0A350NZN2_9ALTE|nr:hypothetical protein [Alteromonas australica]|tara:strand:- start:186 stop:377 length:192 start_codon:yes stop_codon:yes gene_type:complete